MRFAAEMSDSDTMARQHLLRIFAAAVKAVHPSYVVPPNLPKKPKGRCVVIGAGKASAAMALAVEDAWPDVNVSGVVSTRYGHGADCKRVRVIESGHPVPDENSLKASNAIIAALTGLSKDDLVLALISGGGSANMALPIAGLSLVEKQAITQQLLRSGASISDMNCVRQHLSQVKGGGLLRYVGEAQLVTLIISDVPGDNPASVASGPTIVNDTNGKGALDILDRFSITLSPSVRQSLLSIERSTLSNADTSRIIASAEMALGAAAKLAKDFGYQVLNLGGYLECEARELGKAMAGIAQSIQSNAGPLATPAIILSGGETSVTISKNECGRGGRNTEFALSFARSIRGQNSIWALAADTDGLDGTEDAAGAIVTPNSIKRAEALGLNSSQFLDGHDSYSLFEQLGDLLVTGPTHTNVNDLRAILVMASSEKTQ